MNRSNSSKRLIDKYIPSRFGEVVGCRDAVEGLIGFVLSGSPRPNMLVGPPGSGKSMLAVIYVRAVLCEGPGPEPCENCRSCSRVRQTSIASMFGGIRRLNAGGPGNSQDSARDIMDEIYSASDALIIDQADRLRGQAARFLGLLEEVDCGMKPIVLTVTGDRLGDLDRQFRRRFNVVTVSRPSNEELVLHLGEIAAREGHTLSVERLNELVTSLAADATDGEAMMELDGELARIRGRGFLEAAVVPA